MHGIAKDIAATPVVGDVVEGTVLANDKSGVYIDLFPFGTGIIYGRESANAREVIKKINVGDKISAKVVGFHKNDGYIELSLKEARQALVWAEAETHIKTKSVLELPITEANKGGLLIEWQGITGFLPASQLKADHYPRIADGDKDKILDELKKLVGKKLAVSIITANAKEGKLIFSEKAIGGPSEKGSKAAVEQSYKIGDVLSGAVTGTVDFGVFVKLDEGVEGLVHISEIDWGLVEDPKAFVKVGDRVQVKVIEIKDNKVSLSMKALKENPWVAAAKKYKKDQVVKAVVIKYNKHGALASVEEGVAGLVHISEFENEAKLREALEMGKTYTFRISLFDPKDQKMALVFQEKDKKAAVAKK